MDRSSASFGPNPFDTDHKTASKVVKESLADLKLRLAQMRNTGGDTSLKRNDIDNDLRAYEERRRDFEARHASLGSSGRYGGTR